MGVREGVEKEVKEEENGDAITKRKKEKKRKEKGKTSIVWSCLISERECIALPSIFVRRGINSSNSIAPLNKMTMIII